MKSVRGNRTKILALAILVIALAMVAIGCVETKPATDVTTVSATLHGNLTNVAAGETVKVSFQYGTTATYGKESSSKTMTATGPYNIEISGLQAGTTYHYRAKAVGAQTRYGADMTFTTPGVMTTADISLSTDMANRSAWYTIAFNVGSDGAITSNTDDIVLAFPSGTDLPSMIAYNDVSVNGTQVGPGNIAVNEQTLAVTSPVSVPGNGAVTLKISRAAGIKATLSKEPTSADGDGVGSEGYSIGVSTTQEPTVLQSNPYYVYNWISGSPMSAAMADTIMVRGAGFLPGASINLSAIGGAAGGGVVESDGTIELMTFATGLALPITVTDGSGRCASTDSSVTVLPRLHVSPSSGNIGSEVTIKGYDLLGIPTITFGGMAIPTSGLVLQDLDNDTHIDDFQLIITVPLGFNGQMYDYFPPYVNIGEDAGTKVISAIDIDGREAMTTFIVNEPAITVNPASGLPGSTIVVTGTGWPPSANGTPPGFIFFSYSPAHQAFIGDGIVETDSTGQFTEVCTIPSDATPGLCAIIGSFGTIPNQSAALAYFTVIADSDSDGVPDDMDNCPNTANPDQADSDNDGMGDVCDICPNDTANDFDGDGICGNIDNCPISSNPDQADTDGDGIGDACETPMITITPNAGFQNTEITITGEDWPASASGDSAGVIKFVYSPTYQAIIGDGAVETDSFGQFTEICAIPSDAAPGLTAILCTFGTIPNQSVALGYFTVTSPPPSLSITPASGNIGSDVIITGYNFCGTPTAMSIGEIVIDPVDASLQDLDSDGFIDDFQIETIIPIRNLDAGIQEVTAVSGCGSTDTTTFEVSEYTITVEPVTGTVGSSVTVTGTGWSPNASGESAGLLRFGVSPLVHPIIGDGAVETDNNGTFTEICTIPDNAEPGLNAIVCWFGDRFSGANSLGYFTVILDADSDGVPDDVDNCIHYNPDQADADGDGIGDACELPRVGCNPSRGLPNTEITVYGYDFPPNAGGTSEDVIMFAGTILASNIVTDEIGGFEATVRIPAEPLFGIYTISAKIHGKQSMMFPTFFIVLSPETP